MSKKPVPDYDCEAVATKWDSMNRLERVAWLKKVLGEDGLRHFSRGSLPFGSLAEDIQEALIRSCPDGKQGWL